MATPAKAREGWSGWCEEGGRHVVTSGLSSTTLVQQSHPSCVVTIYIHGAGLATIYSDNNNTLLANPFTAQTGGMWQFFANDGVYDVTMTSAGFSQPVTFSSILLCDPFVAGAVCAAGTAGSAHNLLSTTHLDTIPASPPVRGDLVTAQNQTSPTGINPSWARLPLGTSGQVLLSNGSDALWGNLTAGTGITITNNSGSLTIATGGGGGCTLPSHDTAVLSEHPAGTCYDSTHFTWDDTAFNLQISNASANTVGTNNTYLIGPNNTAAGSTFAFGMGTGNFLDTSGQTSVYAFGSGNQVEAVITGGGDILNMAIGHTTVGDSTSATSGGKNNMSVGVGGGIYNSDTVSSFGNSQIGKLAAASSQSFGTVVGGNFIQNKVQGVGSSGTGTVTAFGIFGDANSINQSGTGTVSTAYIGGYSNRVATSLANVSGGSTIWGFDNELDGSVGNVVEIYGSSNTSHTSQVATCLGASDSYIGGMINTATGSGNFGIFGANATVTNRNCVGVYGYNITPAADNTMYYGISSAAELQITAGHAALSVHLDQTAAGKFGNKCAMSAATTCTFSIAASYTGTPLCVTSIDAASAVPATANVAKCSVSGTTVTITAGSSNSLTWDAILIGNPN